jgi:hypothetical protein
MTREDIIAMAQKAGFVWLGEYHSNLEDFATLVASAEREACAKQLDALGCDHCATAIRARGQA